MKAAPAARNAPVQKPRAPVSAAPFAEARPALATMQPRLARRPVFTDDDDYSPGSHHLLLGPRNVRPYRERKLIRKIEEAISRIEDGSYGYCIETGEPIGVKRLEARPVATLCIEAQERRERREKQYGDRDDWYR
jgi:RNA polymerase-binding protein DksA